MKNKSKIIIIILLIVFFSVAYYIFDEYINKNDENNINIQDNMVIDSITPKKESNNKMNNDTVLPIINDNSLNSLSSSTKTKYYKYYYNQLDDNAKKIYDTIENNIDNMKSGTYNVSLPNEVSSILNQKDGMSVLNKEFQSSWDAIMMDRVDLFYIDVSKITLKIKTTKSILNTSYSLLMVPNSDNYLTTGFRNDKDVNTALNQVNNVKQQIISQLSGDEYNKILQVHDCLVDNLSYSDEAGSNAYNIYGGLINKKVVCEGYAESFKYIMDEMGIPCVLISGSARNSEGNTENHEWNYVQVNGKWYAVDVTWDDPIIKGGGKLTNSLKHKYFLKGTEIMDKDHFKDGKFSSEGQNFNYPNLENENY